MAFLDPNEPNWQQDGNRWPPHLIDAALALHDNKLSVAEPLLRTHLKADPFDAQAIRMLAELAGRGWGATRTQKHCCAGRARAEAGFHRRPRQSRHCAVPAEQVSRGDCRARTGCCSDEPGHIGHANLKAAALGRIGRFDEAIGLYEGVLEQVPTQPKVWTSLGHLLKTVGRQAEGVAAYRQAIAIMPELGDAWWSLANLKTLRFDDADIAAMEAALTRDDISDEDRFHLDFALGKAFEDRGEAARAFDHYAAGNALRRTKIVYAPDETAKFVDDSIAVSTPAFFAARAGAGCAAPDPIFVIGMPRSGSTLVEQILSSHPLVEGTSELPDIPAIARPIADYPSGLAALPPAQLRALGEEYLARAAVQRQTDRPYFIDKLPNNWAHLPLIHLILPNATIIDARRHPLGCCFSNFKQHFARGQAFSYGLEDMGRYYRDYARLMAHLEAVLPGRVHRVIYERMVDDTEAEGRALLAACGLDFDPACLDFHKTERGVRTASSEQVRRPIFREGTEGWQAYEGVARSAEAKRWATCCRPIPRRLLFS